MKMKSFAMLAMSGLLAASCLYIAPALADDANTGQTTQTPADNNPNSTPAQNDFSGMDNSGTDTNASSSDMGTNSANPSNQNSPSSPGDEGGPDTATGDDDY